MKLYYFCIADLNELFIMCSRKWHIMWIPSVFLTVCQVTMYISRVLKRHWKIDAEMRSTKVFQENINFEFSNTATRHRCHVTGFTFSIKWKLPLGAHYIACESARLVWIEIRNVDLEYRLDTHRHKHTMKSDRYQHIDL